MSLTGSPGRPLVAPARISLGLCQLSDWIAELSAAAGREVRLDPFALLGERAALSGLRSKGKISCGEQTHLLRCRDGWIAVSLPRESDWDAVPAWLEAPGHDQNWDAVTRSVCERSTRELGERAALLGLAASTLDALRPAAEPAVIARKVADDTSGGITLKNAIVLDLASLWAGPLAAQVLQLAGARVIKVESQTRPDGARTGNPEFFELLHADQESVVLNFATPSGRKALRELLMAADIVIEGSRPRALRQLGIDAYDLLTIGRTQIWLSITAHGWSGRGSERIGFGDDAAVAGGLVARDRHEPRFCVDAVADPITGLNAAAAVLAAFGSGRWHLDVALARVAAVLGGEIARHPWVPGNPGECVPPSSRPRGSAARHLGADTDAVLRELLR